VVEIDESKFGKVKYHRGHRVEGVWVVGGVERTAERKIFLTTVVNRNAQTMKDVITRFVKRGSIIHTDCWPAYNGIPDFVDVEQVASPMGSMVNEIRGLDYLHQTVNHSVSFISEEGIHTNTIEGSWNGIKMMVSARYRTQLQMPWKLVEFIWRRQNQGKIWRSLLNALGEVSFHNLELEDELREEDEAALRTPAFTAYNQNNEIDAENLELVVELDGEGQLDSSESEDISSDTESEIDDSDDDDFVL
jgi:hypothetical protein